MERIQESRKAFDLKRYVHSSGFNKKALERDTAALVIESSGHIHSFFLAAISNQTVVNPSLSKTKPIENYYSEETPQTRAEKKSGVKMKDALINEPEGSICAWVSPPKGEFDYKEGRLEIAKVRKLLGIKVLQCYGIPLKNVSPQYCEKLFLKLEEFSDKPSQNIKNPEDLRDKIVIIVPPANSNWIEFLEKIFPELSLVFEQIKNGQSHRLKLKAIKDAKEEIKKELPKNDPKKNLIYVGARIENGMQRRGWNLSNGVCGYLNRDLLGIENTGFFGMIKIYKVKDQYGDLEFKCPHEDCGKINKRPFGQLIARCQHCGKKVTCEA